MARHSAAAVTLIGLSSLVCLANVVLHVLHVTDKAVELGLLKKRWADKISYKTQVTLAEWWYYIWSVLLTMQVVWMAYSVISTCRKDKTDNYVYRMLPSSVYLFTALANVVRIAQIFLEDYELLPGPFLAAVVVAVLFIAASGCGAYHLEPKIRPPENHNFHRVDVWMVRVFVFNTTAGYGAVSLVDAITKAAVLLAFILPLKVTVANVSTGCLASLLLIFLTWNFTDLGLFGYYTRFLVGPYLANLLSLIAIVCSHYDGARNSVFTVILLVYAGLAVVWKVLVFAHKLCQPVTVRPQNRSINSPYNGL